jgi:hypothetical protein
VTNLQLIAAGYEFGAVPKAGRRLNGQHINSGGNAKSYCRHDEVKSFKRSSLHHALLVFSGKGKQWDATEDEKESDICLTFAVSTSVSFLSL